VVFAVCLWCVRVVCVCVCVSVYTTFNWLKKRTRGCLIDMIGSKQKTPSTLT